MASDPARLRAMGTNQRWGKPYLWLAIHECAHAVAGLALDEIAPIPGPSLRSVTCIPDGESLGRSDRPMRVHPEFSYRHSDFPDADRIAEIHAQHDIVEHLAGPIAEMRYRDRALGAYYLRKDWMPKILSAERHDPTETQQDLINCQQTLRWLDYPDAAEKLERLWSTAKAIVESEWPGIVKMARALREAGTIEGDQFEEQWRAIRPSLQARTRWLALNNMRIEFWTPEAPSALSGSDGTTIADHLA